MPPDTTQYKIVAAPGKAHMLGVNSLLLEATGGIRNNIPPNKGFIPSATGICVMRARRDVQTTPPLSLTYINLPVLVGVAYPIDINDFDPTTSTPTTMYLIVLRQSE